MQPPSDSFVVVLEWDRLVTDGQIAVSSVYAAIRLSVTYP